MAFFWVLCATNGQRNRINSLVARFGVSINWTAQRNTPNTYQSRFQIEAESAQLASDFARIGCVYEIEDCNQRFLYHPGLGIHRQQLDEAGEIVLRAGHVQRLIVEANGSNHELERLLRVAQGIAWMDLLEPYRSGAIRADLLPKAV